jgi:hypothetical protein
MKQISQKSKDRGQLLSVALMISLIALFSIKDYTNSSDERIAILVLIGLFWVTILGYLYMRPVNEEEQIKKEQQNKELQDQAEETNRLRIEAEERHKREETVRIAKEKILKKKPPVVMPFIKSRFAAIKGKITVLNPQQKKRLYIGLGVVVVLLYITNPSMADFKSYVDYDIPKSNYESREQSDDFEFKERVYVRTGYYFIFSVYKVRATNDSQDKRTSKYIGIFNNFFPLKKDYFESK